jgi:drug/metabolite transporter (DMT)-like permease
MNPLIILVFVAVVFNTAAQLVLKVGIDRIGVFTFHWSNFIPIVLKVMASPWIIVGIIIYVGSMGIWLMVLSRIPVSVAYPIASLGYLTSAIAAYYFLGENVTMLRIAGIIVILVGVYMVAKS